ncbi:MAG: tRNA pseudouridine(38-40) synthase TruA [Myxococcales bacterium]|nr:tRNA pseudouridine(38-40) synthase TruA [Myxococcales bacterium]MDH5306487.1 tRNA pseudouridine(38-40) synthase TruA [Myxococcales bacterium]MDH5565666.1 tRNA pseudouridine(38-40) synthase TruA [Myxococcales bacterium]
MSRTFRLTLEYDGEAFAGWQRQPGALRTVQGALESAIARVTGQRVAVVASGRTDAGVHAEGQVVSFRLAGALDARRLRCALNGVLPRDVAVLDARPVPEGFHARRDALSKCYRYAIWNGCNRSPLQARRAFCLQRRLDLEAMRAAARCFVGTHDFASFQAAGASVRSTERTLLRVDLGGRAGESLALHVEGNGFLRHMVRILAGTLIAVGSGRWAPERMPAILAARDRCQAGPTAPAHALTLVAVRYTPPEVRAALRAVAAPPDDFPGRSGS